jgi:hypothetical protein
MADGNAATETLILTMLSDLGKKVDAIVNNQVTRHEFEALGKRLDTLVVKAEFDAYREAHNQWATGENAAIKLMLSTVVPRVEHQQRWDDYDRELKDLKDSRGSWKAWVPPMLGGVSGAALTAGASLLHLIK